MVLNMFCFKRSFNAVLIAISILFLESTIGQASDSGRSDSRRLVDISESSCCKKLELKDHQGRPVSLAKFVGQTVVVVFGFTHCPNVCPTTLLELSAGLADKPYKDNVAVLFVTLDPDRDGEEMLNQYVTAFPPVVALRGTRHGTQATAAEFRVLYREVPGEDDEDYTIEHTAGSYVIDQGGSPVWYVPFGGINSHFWAELEKLAVIQ